MAAFDVWRSTAIVLFVVSSLLVSFVLDSGERATSARVSLEYGASDNVVRVGSDSEARFAAPRRVAAPQDDAVAPPSHLAPDESQLSFLYLFQSFYSSPSKERALELVLKRQRII